MAETSVSRSSGGIVFCGLLTVLFIGLKLTGHVAWSWWWVLSPLWIGCSISIIAFAVIVTIALVAAAAKGR